MTFKPQLYLGFGIRHNTLKALHLIKMISLQYFLDDILSILPMLPSLLFHESCVCIIVIAAVSGLQYASPSV